MATDDVVFVHITVQGYIEVDTETGEILRAAAYGDEMEFISNTDDQYIIVTVPDEKWRKARDIYESKMYSIDWDHG